MKECYSREREIERERERNATTFELPPQKSSHSGATSLTSVRFMFATFPTRLKFESINKHYMHLFLACSRLLAVECSRAVLNCSRLIWERSIVSSVFTQLHKTPRKIMYSILHWHGCCYLKNNLWKNHVNCRTCNCKEPSHMRRHTPTLTCTHTHTHTEFEK